MSYKIAVASSDELHVDETFGRAKVFHIYEVTGGTYVKAEDRMVGDDFRAEEAAQSKQIVTSKEGCESSGSCGNGGCHTGPGGGCMGSEGASQKVELLSDCRCIVCRKIGFHIQKQLERRAITAFDVSCTVEEALTKISAYFNKVDSHQSLRGSSK